jgi:hypothetical protein
MTDQSTDATIRRFRAISWHDSKLLETSIFRRGSDEQVRISLMLRDERGALTPAAIVFKDATFVQLEFDLAGKRLCGDDISGAECLATSAWTKALANHNPHDSFDGYLHFEIGLIPPGGRIDVLAKDFCVEARSEV